MIKIKNSLIYVKNIAKPKKIELKVRAGIVNNDLCKNTFTDINLDATPYLEGGQNSTGNVMIDLENYIMNIYNKIIDECYFDLQKVEDHHIIKKLVGYYMGTDQDRNDALGYIPKGFAFYHRNINVLREFAKMGIFNVIVENVDIDVEFLNMFESIATFQLLFSGSELDTERCVYRGTDKYTMNMLSFGRCYNILQFMDTLTRVFFYYANQEVRDEYTARALGIYLSSTNAHTLESVCKWDQHTNRFMVHLTSDNHNLSNVAFNVNKICSDIRNGYSIGLKVYGISEQMSPLDCARIIPDNENVYITSIPKDVSGLIACKEIIDSHCAYVPYLNKSGQSEAVGIQLFSRFQDKNVTNLIRTVMYGRRSITKRRLYLSVSNYDTLGYDTINHVNRGHINSSIEYGCTIAYFTRGGGITYIDEMDLLDKKIPVQRRNLILRAYCELCAELGINPTIVADSLKQKYDFMRFYKSPIEVI